MLLTTINKGKLFKKQFRGKNNLQNARSSGEKFLFTGSNIYWMLSLKMSVFANSILLPRKFVLLCYIASTIRSSPYFQNQIILTSSRSIILSPFKSQCSNEAAGP